MSEYKITNAGRSLMADMLAGLDTALFTRIEVSSHDYTGAELEELTSIEDVEQTSTVSGVVKKDSATIQVIAAVENKNLSVGYYMRTVGLYAKNSANVEILYSVFSAGSEADYMPAGGGRTNTGKTFRLNTKVGEASQVDMTVDPAAYATSAQLDDVITSIAGKADAIQFDGENNLLKLYADGEVISTTPIKSGTTIHLADVSGAAVTTHARSTFFTWTDPIDMEVAGSKIAEWDKTILVRKEGSSPANVNDGTVVLTETVRNQYTNTPFEDVNLDYDTLYYYRFFVRSKDGVYTEGTALSITPFRKIIETLPTQSGSLTYSGSAQSPSWSNYDSSKLTEDGDTSETGAGSYVATFTPKEGYKWWDDSLTAKQAEWSIGKQPVAEPVVSSSLVYNGGSQDASVSAYDPAVISITGLSGTDAGSYTATLHLLDTDNYEWTDSTIADKTQAWSIAKAAGSFQMSTSSVTLNGDNKTATVTLTSPSNGQFSASSSDTSIATASLSGNVISIASVDDTTGTATITVSQGAGDNYEAPSSQVISVTAQFTTVYGAEWDGTSTTSWSRTDASALFTDPVPAVSNGNGSSPFDNLMPWSGMQVSERTGGSMVSIPKFYYKLTQNGTGLRAQIADGPLDGYSVSPAHMDRRDGKGERDVVYIGRYHCASDDYKSKPGVKPKASITRATARSGIHALGSNIWQCDILMRCTIWLLYIAEFANWESQGKIGYGCGNNSATENMGYTDAMTYHTGTKQAQRTSYGLGTQYRHIEGLWDNVYDWCDGCYYNSNGLNIILNPANFSDSTGGVLIGKPSSGYPSKFAVGSAAGFPMFYPTEANGSDSTYSCDYWGYDASYPCLYVGGNYGRDRGRGLFCVSCSSASSSNANIGCRLQELP